MRTYWSFLELLKDHLSFSVVVLVDLKTNEDVIRQFIASSPIKPEQYVILENKNDAICVQATNQLDIIHAKQRIDKVIIATDPCSHGAYIEWALKRDIDTLVEKPIVAFVDVNQKQEHAQKIEEYVERIAEQDVNDKISIQTQRRYNAAYSFVYSYIKEFIREFKVPISFLSVHQEDGLWNSVNEFLNEEAHPYKYGYGKLMHSGYHYVDLFCWFSQLNNLLNDERWADEMSIATEVFGPADLANQLRNFTHLRSSFVQNSAMVPRTLGEIDCYNGIQLKKNECAVLTGRIDMMQNSVSSRTDFSNTYSGKLRSGTRKYEEVSLYVGPLLKIKIFTAGERRADVREYHFNVEIQRNAALVGGKEFEALDFRSEYGTVYNSTQPWTPNQVARLRLFDAFISGRETISKIKSHRETNRLLSLMYKNIVAIHHDGIPYSKISV